MQMLTSLRRNGAALVLASLVLAGCGSDGGSEPDSSLANAVISNVSLVGTTGTVAFRSDAAPAGGAGPAAVVSVLGSAVPGGSAQVQVTAPSSFTRIIVALGDETDGYYEITLNSAVDAATLALALSENVDVSELLTRFAVGTGSGIGSYDEATVDVITTTGTGDVQVSISWNSNADVDLHVIDPSGEEIYYGNKEGANGTLDLDSNAACDLDNIRNENVTFPGPAPRGTYSFYVDLWSACSTTSTNWVVTVRRKGQATQTFTGSFGSTTGESTPVSFTY
jgi:hypothetical protein